MNDPRRLISVDTSVDEPGETGPRPAMLRHVPVQFQARYRVPDTPSRIMRLCAGWREQVLSANYEGMLIKNARGGSGRGCPLEQSMGC